ncbi:MAG: metal-dependent transcriptional regulator [Thermoplasmata archaeon]
MKHNREDYILTIWELMESMGNATEKTVSGRLGVALPSAWEEIHRLETEKLIIIGKKGLRFTQGGFREARRIVMAHRITEYFVYAYLEVPWDEVHNSVMDLEHDFNENLLANLYRKMGYPKYCPHGNPINPNARIYEIEASELGDGSYYFVRATYEDYSLLKGLFRGGALPGKRVKVERLEDGIRIEGENGEVFIGKDYEKAIRLSDRAMQKERISMEGTWIPLGSGI